MKLLLRQARQDHGLSQPQAAARCGVSLSAWEKWEGGAEMKPHVLAGVPLMLDVNPETALQAARALLSTTDKPE